MPKITPDEIVGRDDFSSITRDILAKRSGYICAYPGCRRMTIAGSHDRKSGLTMTGVAAHIAAASKKGPRFDSEMSSDERTSEQNGIWTCQIHGKFIDDNPSKCTAQELHRWKSQHEQWVFDRVEQGMELFNDGIYRVEFRAVGVFLESYSIPLAMHNILVAPNDAGKTTFAQIIAAFSGGQHWINFNERFKFKLQRTDESFIEISRQKNDHKTKVRLCPQTLNTEKSSARRKRNRIHIILNGSPSIDWPRQNFKVLYFEDQLARTGPADPKDSFVKAIRYLANIFSIHEDIIWDSLRDEFFVDSLFGYRIRRVGHRKLQVKVPDGRDFYIPHAGLSFTEKQLTFLEIALKLLSITPNSENWLLILDSGFFQRLDQARKAEVFKKLTNRLDRRLQTLFCVSSSEDAFILKELNIERWANAMEFKGLTLHSFL
jgi:hypothetical protein